MTRPSAAVLATAAVALAAAGIPASAADDTAVRAEVAFAGKSQPLDVRRIRIVDGLRPGRSYRLPAVGVRNQRNIRTTHRLVILSGAGHHWLRVVPAEVAIDAGGSRAVGLRLEVPDGAASGAYAVIIRARPGGAERALVTFRIAATESRGFRGRVAGLAMWIVPALAGAVLVAVRARVGA